MAKENIIKMKRGPNAWENIFANDTSDKGLISKIYKKLIWLNARKTDNPFLKNIFIDYAITVVPFPPFTPLHPAHPLPSTFPPYSSCPWVIQISSLASTFPILFLPSPCLFCTYHLCYLFSVPFPSFFPLPLPADSLSCDLHFCDSVSLPVVCLVCFCLRFVFLGSVVDNCLYCHFPVHSFRSSSFS